MGALRENGLWAGEAKEKQVYCKFMRLILCECNEQNDFSRINPDFYRKKPNELTILLFCGEVKNFCAWAFDALIVRWVVIYRLMQSAFS